MLNIGIMQGRLTEPKGRGIQFFPFDNWDNEFCIASQIGLSEIEFIFDYENYTNNPLWSSEGVKRIKELTVKTGVAVKSICFDYFMRRPFFKISDLGEYKKLREENKYFLKRIIKSSLDIGARLIEIPLVDDSSIKSQNEKELFKEFILEVVEYIGHSNVRIGLETDFPPEEFKYFLQDIGCNIRANYDSGNSSGLGYNQYEEIKTLNEYIENIHIKDRIYKGGTVSLGNGSADFEALFKALKEIGYDKSFILQVARGKAGNEKEEIMKQIEFVKGYIDKYNLRGVSFGFIAER